ncbi:MAG: hypothetical protein ABIH39_00835 [Candidatus Margulisiibacteriota bacterium]
MNRIHKLFKDRLTVINVLSAVGLALFFILLRWNTVNIPFIRDEGEYIYDAWLMLKNISPYLNSFSQTPPMIIYTYAAAILLNPNAFWAPRVIIYLFVALATILLGLIARKELGRGAGWIAMWVVTPLILFPQLKAFPAKQEKCLLLPLMGLLYGYLYWNKNSTRRHWFVAGILAVVTLLYKPTVLLVILFVFAFQVFDVWKYKPDLKQLLKKISWGILGAALTLFTAFAFFIFHKSLPAFWESVVAFNMYYTDWGGFGWESLFKHIKIFWSNWWVLYLLTAYYLIRRPGRWWFYTGLFAAALLSTAGGIYSQYYIPLMPFWALVVTGAIICLSDDIALKAKLPSGYFKAGITAVVIILLVWPSRQELLMSPRIFQLMHDRGPSHIGGNPFYESPIVAEKIKQMTAPDDYVYIAGSEPQILYYARRQSPTRFIWAYPLMLSPKALQYQQEVIRDLEQNPPELIVFVTDKRSWFRYKTSPTLLMDYLSGLNQNKKYIVLGGFVQTRDGGFWQEPMIAGKYPQSQYSLIVLKKGNSK